MSGLDASSDTASTIGRDNITVNRNIPLPEQWTLPTEWNIEQRELYGAWKMDVQNQIKFLDTQLGYSLHKNPQPELGRYHYTHDPFWEVQRDNTSRENAGKMQKGLQARK